MKEAVLAQAGINFYARVTKVHNVRKRTISVHSGHNCIDHNASTPNPTTFFSASSKDHYSSNIFVNSNKNTPTATKPIEHAESAALKQLEQVFRNPIAKNMGLIGEGDRELTKRNPTFTLDCTRIKHVKSQQVILREMVHPPRFRIDLLSPTVNVDCITVVVSIK